MGYLQQEPVEPEGQMALLNKIGLPMVHRIPLIHRQESQGKLP
jgi:hypothetical protein